MKAQQVFLLLIALVFLCPAGLDAQRRRKKNKEDWPPERAYSRIFLGGALQDVFERHYDFCGFVKPSGKRDYTPPTIEKFLGKRTLRTRVEKADINGGNLLSYIFSAQETGVPLNAIRYRSDNLLYNQRDGVNLLPQPRDGFDSFVLTKNCSGYLKSSLDAGLKPPYAAFSAALDTDAQRNSSVLAMAGSFESPLAGILAANDARTTELMALLWQFYQERPEYNGQAYYLRQFDGVMVKHLTDSREVMAAEQQIGINVSLPLAAKFSAGLTHGRQNENTFSGSDWETIVYADFKGPYTRERLFAPLPTPQDIAAYFASTPLVSGQVPPPLREGGSHAHSIEVTGLPAEFASAGWQLQNIRGNAYRGTPNLTVQARTNGLTFTVAGYTDPELFANSALEVVPMYYELVLPARNYQPELRIPVSQRIGTSAHPLINLAGARFELRRKNNTQYAFQWHLAMSVEDRENPLDATSRFDALNIQAGYADRPLDVKLVSYDYDARRSLLNLTLESERTWPLRDIDDRNMMTMPLRMEVCLPVKDGYSLCRRPVATNLAVPRIRAPLTRPIPGGSIPGSRGPERG